MRIFVKPLHGTTITLEVDDTKPNYSYTWEDDPLRSPLTSMWEIIWDKLGVRTDERNELCWNLIVDGCKLKTNRTISDYLGPSGIQKDSMLLLVRTSWMVCIKCNIPYGRDANQCSNRVFQRGSDGNCSLCSGKWDPTSDDDDFSHLDREWGKRNEEKHKIHSNGNQYCFWGLECAGSRGDLPTPYYANCHVGKFGKITFFWQRSSESREESHLKWRAEDWPKLPLDAWYEYCCNCAKTEFDSGLSEDERFSPWRYSEKKYFELAQRPPPSQCAHCKNRETTEGEASRKVLRDL